MALFESKLYSHVLHTSTQVSVYIPDRKRVVVPSFNVVLLLHGMCGDGRDFFLRTRIADYADENDCVLIAPSCGNNYFADGKNGLKYETYLFGELMPYLRAVFGFNASRGKNFLLGTSMGAFAAVRIGLTHPDAFCAVCSLSAPIDLKSAVETLRDNLKDCRRRAFCSVYGSTEEFGGSSSDIMHLIGEVDAETAPEMYLYVGANDPLLQFNCYVFEKLATRGFRVRLESDDGAHDWKSWDRQAEKFLTFYSGQSGEKS